MENQVQNIKQPTYPKLMEEARQDGMWMKYRRVKIHGKCVLAARSFLGVISSSEVG